ncbi:MAG: hypothetical protein K6A32_02965 [Bacteroidales bacterium]|nr:hypothetical protein [Bacteroidales bacterium]
MRNLQRQVAQPHTSGRTASCDGSFSLTRRVVQPHTTGRSASCDGSLSLVCMDC